MLKAFVLCCSVAALGTAGTANAQDWTKSKWGPNDEIGAANYITPELVVQNRKTSAAAAAIAGSRRGRVTVVKARSGAAPDTWAAWASRGSRPDQAAPTTRTTTAVLRSTWAHSTGTRLGPA